MSIKLMSAIFETEFRDLVDGEGNVTKASTAKLVLLALADHANDEGESAYPSVDRMCKKTALTEQTIRNTFDALRFNGIVFLAGMSKYRTNNYTINIKSFPRTAGEDGTLLTLYPLDPLMSEVEGSNGSLLTPHPLDPNHSLTVKESSLDENSKKEIIAKSGLEWQILAGQEIAQEEINKNVLEKETIDAFESAFSIKGNWNWYPAKPQEMKVWEKFRAVLIQLYQADKDCFTKYVTWIAQPYSRGTMTGLQIKRNPQDFPDAWASFCMGTGYKSPRQIVPDSERTDLDDDGAPISYM